MRVIGLRCEHREDIPCIDDPAPRLSWALESDQPGKHQTAYRIRVGDVWDSGRISSGRIVDVEYGGPPLAPAAEFAWQVQVWDEAGEPSEWSEPARLRTAIWSMRTQATRSSPRTATGERRPARSCTPTC